MTGEWRISTLPTRTSGPMIGVTRFTSTSTALTLACSLTMMAEFMFRDHGEKALFMSAYAASDNLRLTLRLEKLFQTPGKSEMGGRRATRKVHMCIK